MDGISSSIYPDDDTASFASHYPPQPQPWAAAAAANQQDMFDFAPGMGFTAHAWAPIVTPARRSLDMAQRPHPATVSDESDDLSDDLAEQLHVHRPGSYGEMPTALAEQVLSSSPQPERKQQSAASMLPDDLPGQSNSGQPSTTGRDAEANEPFSLFSSGAQMAHGSSINAIPLQQRPAVRGGAAASRPVPIPSGRGGRNATSCEQEPISNVVPGAKWGLEMRGDEHRSKATGRPAVRATAASSKLLLNEVVCGALMLAYERSGKWAGALAVLDRARRLGIAPNTIMYNTAISALAKSGCAEAAEELFGEIPEPDAVSYETLIAAYGMAGLTEKAEAVFRAMSKVGHAPRDYAYCGLIAAYSMKGDWRGALRVRQVMRRNGVPLTVHVYNALLAACERAQQW